MTNTEPNRPGITFRERMAGPFSLEATEPRAGAEAGAAAGTELTMHATVHIHDVPRFIEDPEHAGELTGRIDFPPIGLQIPASEGVFNLFSPADNPDLKLMVYELAFDWDGQPHYLAGRKEVHNDPGFDLWSDTTTLFTTLHRGTDASGEVIGAGVLTLGMSDLLRMIPTFSVTNASSPAEGAATLARFGHFFMGELWDRYGPVLSWWRRLLRKLHLG